MNAVEVDEELEGCSTPEAVLMMPSREDREEEWEEDTLLEDTGLSEVRQLAVALGLFEVDDLAPCG